MDQCHATMMAARKRGIRLTQKTCVDFYQMSLKVTQDHREWRSSKGHAHISSLVSTSLSLTASNITRRWHVTISCQPDGRPPQPVRPWKSGRVHLADGSKVVVLVLPYSTEFGRESRKLASGVRKYGKFDDGR